MRTILYRLIILLTLGLGPAVSHADNSPVADGLANLLARVTARPPSATEGGPVTFTIDVTNRASMAALGVTVTNRLPEGVAFVASEPPASQVNGGQEGEEVVVALNKLPAGASSTVIITGRVTSVHFDGAEGTVVTNKTAVGALNFQPIVVVLPIPVFVRRDFGDAPDPTYPVLRANNGARHRITSLYLGATVDSESDGQPSSQADGDDANGADDEDGVVFLSPFVVGGVATIQVTASLAGILDAWADYNADGDWFDAGEHMIVGAAIPAGVSTLTISIPAWAVAGKCYLRFRLSPAGAPLPVGFINGGEVEDYAVEMSAPTKPTASGALQVRADGERVRVTWDKPNALLQAAPGMEGPWTTLIDASSPYEAPADVRHRFFRLIEGRAASRAGMERRDFATMAREADLIVDGIVTDVAYRNSDGDGTNDVSWPHTFVTLQVLDVLKGRVYGTNLCLRFLGGLDTDGERIMKLENTTRFDVGERSILFVKRNGFLACPLVGGADGRLRVADGLVYSEHGHRLVLTGNQKLAFGLRENLLEAQEDWVGSHRVGREHVEGIGEGPRPMRAIGEQLGVAEFKARLAEIVRQNQTLLETQIPVLTLSADATRAFRIPKPRHRPPPAVINNVVPALAAAEDEESTQLRANGGSPVLPLHP